MQKQKVDSLVRECLISVKKTQKLVQSGGNIRIVSPYQKLISYSIGSELVRLVDVYGDYVIHVFLYYSDRAMKGEQHCAARYREYMSFAKCVDIVAGYKGTDPKALEKKKAAQNLIDTSRAKMNLKDRRKSG